MLSKLDGRAISVLTLTLAALGCGEATDPGTEPGGTGGTTAGAGGSTSADGGGTGSGTGGNSTTPDACGEYALDLTDYAATSSVATPITGEWNGLRELFGLGADLYILGAELSVIRGDSTTPEVIGTDIPELSLGGYVDARRRLIVDATHAYFTTAAGISRVALDSGTTETVFDGVVDGYTSDLWIADSELLFTLAGGDATGIYRVPLDGSAEPTLVTDVLDPLGFSYEDGTLYSGTASDTIASLPLAGGTPTTITNHTAGIFPYYHFVTASEGQLFWSDDGTLMNCALPDCSAPAELPGRATDGLVLHGERLFWQTDALGSVSRDGATCQNLVFGEWPDNVGIWGVTDDYAYLAGSFDGDFEPTVLIRLPY